MIRIKLIKEGRVVKQISSRLHESVILEQLKNYNEVVDEIVYEGELSEGAEEILRKVAKKVIPAAMAAGIALGGASTAKAQNYFPGTDRSVGQHIADIFSPNYREIQRQRQAERNTRQREFDAYHREVERGRVQAARDAGRRQTGQMSGSAMPSNVKVYDQARISADGKSIILYDMNHQVTRLPRTGTDFVAGDSQRLSHYIRGSQVYYVRHAAVRESIEEINEDPTVGTIPAAGGPITTKKPIGSTGTRPTAGSAVANNQAAKAAAAGVEDQEDDKEDLAALRKAGQMLSGIKEEVGLDEMDSHTADDYRREKRYNSPEQKAKREKEQQHRLKSISPELRRKLKLPEPKKTNEEVEQIDEISKKTVASYSAKAGKEVKGNQPSDPEKLRKRTNREQGMKLAYKKYHGFKSVPATEEGKMSRLEQRIMREAIEPKLQDILNKYQSSWEDFKQGGDITDNDAFYNELYAHFSDEMPYGVQKARDGDPASWITDRLDSLVNEAADSNDNEMLADKNIIMQIRKAADYDKPTKLRLDDGSTVVVAPLVAAELLKMFKIFKPESKLLMQQVLNKQDGFKRLISHLKVKQINSQASTIANRIFDQAVKESTMDAGLQKYIAAYPEEVSADLAALKAKAEEEMGGTKNRWAIGKLPDGRYVSALIGNIKKWNLPIAAQAEV